MVVAIATQVGAPEGGESCVLVGMQRVELAQRGEKVRTRQCVDGVALRRRVQAVLADQVGDRIEQLVQETLRQVLAMGGTVAAEHGIGKIKRRWLPMQASELQLRVMRALKRELDPLGLLAPGNVL